MSQPSPDVYEQGRGMDAHNEVMREVRGRNDRSYDPTEPTRVWLDEDNTPDGVYDSLTIILNTGGCRWARAGGCTMCGYVAESVDGGTVAHEDLMTQVEACLEYERENAEKYIGARGLGVLLVYALVVDAPVGEVDASDVVVESTQVGHDNQYHLIIGPNRRNVCYVGVTTDGYGRARRVPARKEHAGRSRR